MAYDPDKLRQLLLGISSDDDEPEEDEAGKSPGQEIKSTGAHGHESSLESEPAERHAPVVNPAQEQLKPLEPEQEEVLSVTEAGIFGDAVESAAKVEEKKIITDGPHKKAESDFTTPEFKVNVEPVRSEQSAPPNPPAEQADKQMPDEGLNKSKPPRLPEPHANKEDSGTDFSPLRQVLISRETQRKTTPDEITAVRDRIKSGKASQTAYSPEEEEPEEKPEGRNAKKAKAKKNKKKIKREPKPRRGISPDEITPPSPLTLMMLIGGGVALLGATIALATGKTGAPVAGLGILGAALVGIFAIINRMWLHAALTTRSARYSVNITTVVLSLLGILIFGNILSYRYHYRIDLSSEGLNSLSPQSVQVLDDINRAGETIIVTAFTQPDSGYRDTIEKLMDLYRYRSSKLQFSFVDPDVKPELAESKGVTRNPSIVFELGNKKSIVTDVDEQHFTSALLTVRQTQSRVVAFLTGHGEPDPNSDANDQSGISAFKTQLELEGYRVNTLRIPESNGVPAETSLLIIASPQRDLEPAETSAIERYLDGGGSVMCLLEPGSQAGLTELLAKYGISFKNGVVLDDQRNAYGELLSPVVTGNPENTITASLPDGMVFMRAGSLSFTTANRYHDVSVQSIVRSSSSSWLELTDQYQFDENEDTRKAEEMAVLSTRVLERVQPEAEETAEAGSENPDSYSEEDADTEESPNSKTSGAGTEGSVTKIAQVMVVSDGSFIQNANWARYYNMDFAMNSVNYLASSHELISIRAPQAANRTLDISNAQKNVIFAVSVILTPLLIAALGGFVWWKRR